MESKIVKMVGTTSAVLMAGSLLAIVGGFGEIGYNVFKFHSEFPNYKSENSHGMTKEEFEMLPSEAKKYSSRIKYGFEIVCASCVLFALSAQGASLIYQDPKLEDKEKLDRYGVKNE